MADAPSAATTAAARLCAVCNIEHTPGSFFRATTSCLWVCTSTPTWISKGTKGSNSRPGATAKVSQCRSGRPGPPQQHSASPLRAAQPATAAAGVGLQHPTQKQQTTVHAWQRRSNATLVHRLVHALHAHAPEQTALHCSTHQTPGRSHPFPTDHLLQHSTCQRPRGRRRCRWVCPPWWPCRQRPARGAATRRLRPPWWWWLSRRRQRGWGSATQ